MKEHLPLTLRESPQQLERGECHIIRGRPLRLSPFLARGTVRTRRSKSTHSQRQWYCSDRHIPSMERYVQLWHSRGVALRNHPKAERYPARMPELSRALHTRDAPVGTVPLSLGMRLFRASCSDRAPHQEWQSAQGSTSNDVALATFQLLWRFSEGKGQVFLHLYRSKDTILL